MHWELIYEESREGFDIQFFVAPEQDDPRDHFDDDGETARAIAEGRYDWFTARVCASKAGVLLGNDYLGACCYETARDFVGPGYYEDMVAEAIAQARNALLALGVAPTEIMAPRFTLHGPQKNGKTSFVATDTVSDEERSYGPHQAALMRGAA